jgi:shikimate dehydrogenase
MKDSAIRCFGLFGKTLQHSFSPQYFEEKFQKTNILDAEYKAYPLERIEDFPALLTQVPNIAGLNVTIPYKETIIPYLDSLSEAAKSIGAVNTIEFLPNGTLRGHNTDVDGFLSTLLLLKIFHSNLTSALVLGTGGASKAVCYVLESKNIHYKLVSRHPQKGQLGYSDLDRTLLKRYPLLINTTPLGMYPNINEAPLMNCQYLTKEHVLIDLIYNPEETLWLKNAKRQGAFTQNGLTMLKQQAEKAWQIWNEK